MPKYDEYFNQVLLVVDADISIGRNIKNALKLPTINGKNYNPERTIYEYILELEKGTDSKFSDTYNELLQEGISQDRLRNEFLNSEVNIGDRDSSKKWFNSILEKLKQYKILEHWASDHPYVMKKFMGNLEDKLDMLTNTV